ncbi:unnamed protein product (mitochondrion) [Plasmodiophora brassicae]|uniref:Uncharacterized protein n=1 Tax=Plasmodiophora brassicae TaxID=37360 RepID=A0A0G4IW94_PLABS|nr:hypothetical protein PBRA_007250 [Plasmodiophora brassicae]SPQ95987.1 unnamed protein product [Plasmodiophora brassicae]
MADSWPRLPSRPFGLDPGLRDRVLLVREHHLQRLRQRCRLDRERSYATEMTAPTANPLLVSACDTPSRSATARALCQNDRRTSFIVAMNRKWNQGVRSRDAANRFTRSTICHSGTQYADLVASYMLGTGGNPVERMRIGVADRDFQGALTHDIWTSTVGSRSWTEIRDADRADVMGRQLHDLAGIAQAVALEDIRQAMTVIVGHLSLASDVEPVAQSRHGPSRITNRRQALDGENCPAAGRS